MARCSDRRQHGADGIGQSAQRPHLGLERGALGRGDGQCAVDHELHHVAEGSLRGELDGRVLAVVVEALGAADVADLGVGDHHALEAAGHLGRAEVGDAHQVAQRHDAHQFAVVHHRHVPVAALAHGAQRCRGVERRVDHVGRCGHRVRHVAEVGAAGRRPAEHVALGDHAAHGACVVDHHHRADAAVVHALDHAGERLVLGGGHHGCAHDLFDRRHASMVRARTDTDQR